MAPVGLVLKTGSGVSIGRGDVGSCVPGCGVSTGAGIEAQDSKLNRIIKGKKIKACTLITPFVPLLGLEKLISG